MREFENQALKKKSAGIRTLLVPFRAVCDKEEPRLGKLCGQNLGNAGCQNTGGWEVRRVASPCTGKPLSTLNTRGARAEAPKCARLIGLVNQKVQCRGQCLYLTH